MALVFGFAETVPRAAKAMAKERAETIVKEVGGRSAVWYGRKKRVGDVGDFVPKPGAMRGAGLWGCPPLARDTAASRGGGP